MVHKATSHASTPWRHPSVREVYRDEVVWVLDKPAGIVMHPNPPARRASNALVRGIYDFKHEQYALPRSLGGPEYVCLAHRLDRETSGLLVCTFQLDAAGILREAFFNGEVQKEYRALVIGKPPSRRGLWRNRLEKQGSRGQVTVQVRAGKPNAVAEYQVLKEFGREGLTLLALRPQTGRTHQLRVQAACRGLPIAGDDRYGDFAANRNLSRTLGLKHMFLHAFRLQFRHPRTRHLMRFDAPYSSRLAVPLEKLRAP